MLRQWKAFHSWQDPLSQTTTLPHKRKPPCSPQIQSHVHYFLNMSWRGPGKNFRTVSKMLSSSSSSSSPHPAGMAFFGRVSEPSQACSMAAFSSASFSSFFFSPYYIIIKDSDHKQDEVFKELNDFFCFLNFFCFLSILEHCGFQWMTNSKFLWLKYSWNFFSMIKKLTLCVKKKTLFKSH